MEQTKTKRLIVVIISLIVVLSLAVVFLLVQGGIFKENAVTDEDFKYIVLDDGTAEIIDYDGSDIDIKIPSKLDGYSVASIGEDAFSRMELTSVEIPNSVKIIGSNAFNNCYSLTSVTIGNSVTSIDSYAFSDCDSLTNIMVVEGNSNYSSVDGILFNKDKTELVLYPDGKVEKSYTIPNSVKSIGEEAFSGCYERTSVVMPDSVEKIGDSAFCYCQSLASVKMSNSIKRIASNAFDETEIYYDEKNWENNALYIDDYLIATDDITGKYQVKTGTKLISDYAFEGCDSLTSVTIGNSVTSIGEGAFLYCDSLTSITVAKDNINYLSENGVLFNKDKTELILYPIGKKVTSYKIPKSVTSIGDYAFYNYELLKSVELHESVASIGDSAFSGTALIGIEIPNSVKSIGDSAFSDTPLKSVELPFVERVGDYAFSVCDSLTSVEIGNATTSIGECAFDLCESMRSITVSEDNANFSSEDGVLFNKNKTELILYPIGKTATSYIIPNSVVCIVEEAFQHCKFLKSIEIPNSVKSIGDSAFNNCTKITSVELPCVERVDDYAFSNCDSLISVVIGNATTRIGKYAFESTPSMSSITVSEDNANFSSEDGVLFNKDKTELIIYPKGKMATSYTVPDSVVSICDESFDCSSLTTITIGDSVEKIGDSAFEYCRLLTSVSIGNSVEKIGDYAFSCCDSLKNVIIGNSVIRIGESAFSSCESLKNIDIPNSVTSIGDYAFDECTSLKSVTIGNSVESIGEYAFDECESIKSVEFIGTKEQWNKIAIGDGNKALKEATINFREN